MKFMIARCASAVPPAGWLPPWASVELRS
jgi:hypothetical protein